MESKKSLERGKSSRRQLIDSEWESCQWRQLDIVFEHLYRFKHFQEIPSKVIENWHNWLTTPRPVAIRRVSRHVPIERPNGIVTQYIKLTNIDRGRS